MDLTFECPRCEQVGEVREVETRTEARCACGLSRPLHDGAIEGNELRACPWCGTEDLYIQKDFPHILGLLIVVAGFGVSTLFWYFYMPVFSLGTLFLTAALDLALYYLVPEVTICYRCLSQYRGPGVNPEGRFQPFDLAVGERYRQERIRVAELKRKGRSTEPESSP